MHMRTLQRLQGGTWVPELRCNSHLREVQRISQEEGAERRGLRRTYYSVKLTVLRRR
jgi:hypothetical protein